MHLKKYALLCWTTASLALSAADNTDEIASFCDHKNEKGACSSVASSNNSKQKMQQKEMAPPTLIDGNTNGTLVSGCANFDFDIDFLLYNRTTSPIALSNGIGILFDSAGSATAQNVVNEGSNYSQSFGFKPGVRASMGVDFNYDGWDLTGTYSWVKFNDTSRFAFPPAGDGKGWTQNFNFFQDLQSNLITRSMTDTYKMTINLADLSLGRKFYTSKCLLLRPSIGISASYIPQQRKVSYTYDVPAVVVKREIFQNNGHGFGFGARIGLDSEWRLATNWSILGNLGFTGLYTTYSDKASLTQYNLGSGVTTVILKSGLSLGDMQFLQSIFLGIDWHTYFCADKYFVSVHAGWDFMHGFTNWLTSTLSNRLQDSFAIQGLRTGVEFNF